MLRNCTVAPLIFILLFSLSGCSKPPYWVKGLTLPPGSAVQDVRESKTLGMASATPGLGKMKRSLSVGFENPGGWAGVSAHFDRVLGAQGYHESFSEMAGMMPVGASEMISGVRTYTKPGSTFTVMVQDLRGMQKALGGDLPSGMSGFHMTLLELE